MGWNFLSNMRLHWKRRGAPNSKSSSRSASSPPKIIGDGRSFLFHTLLLWMLLWREASSHAIQWQAAAHTSVLLQLRTNSSSLNYQRHSAGHTYGIKKNVDTVAQILPPATAQLLSSPVFRCIEDTDRQYMCGELATSLRLSWWNLTLLYSICKNWRIGLQTCRWLCFNCVISDCGSYRAILSSYLFRIAKKKHLVAVI